MTNKYWGVCALLAVAACGPKTMHDVGDLETGGTTTAGSGTTAGSNAGASGGGGGQGTAAAGGEGGEAARHEFPPCRCTRREPELRCMPGSGVSATTEIGTDGGRAQLDVGVGVSFAIDFPPRASQAEFQVSLTQTPFEPPAGFVDYSPVYLAEAEPALDDGFFRLQLPTDNRDGTIGRAMAIYTFSEPGEEPKRIADSSMNAGFMQGSTQNLGYFFAGYPIEAEDVCP